MEVAQKYAKNPNASEYLAQKVIKGGSGVWGETAMAAHPNLPESDIRSIIQWVLSLSNQAGIKKSLPQKGTITPPANTKPGAAFVLSASYTDKGGNNIKALTGRNAAVLNSNTVMFKGTEKMSGFVVYNTNNTNYMVLPKQQAWFALDSLMHRTCHVSGIVDVLRRAPSSPVDRPRSRQARRQQRDEGRSSRESPGRREGPHPGGVATSPIRSLVR